MKTLFSIKDFVTYLNVRFYCEFNDFFNKNHDQYDDKWWSIQRRCNNLHSQMFCSASLVMYVFLCAIHELYQNEKDKLSGFMAHYRMPDFELYTSNYRLLFEQEYDIALDCYISPEAMTDIVIPVMRTEIFDYLNRQDRIAGSQYDWFDKEKIRILFEKNLYTLAREWTKQHSLTQIETTSTDNIHYYLRNLFSEDLRNYFEVKDENGETRIEDVSAENSQRVKDAIHESRTPFQNMLFSVATLYLIIVNNAINMNCDEQTQYAFYASRKWPRFVKKEDWDTLFPLKTLKSAGLAPTTNEALLYIDVIKRVFPILQQEFQEILNGNGSFQLYDWGEWDIEALKFFSASIKGHTRKHILSSVSLATYDVIDQLRHDVDNQINHIL